MPQLKPPQPKAAAEVDQDTTSASALIAAGEVSRTSERDALLVQVVDQSNVETEKVAAASAATKIIRAEEAQQAEAGSQPAGDARTESFGGGTLAVFY